jgi:hypothetical protein
LIGKVPRDEQFRPRGIQPKWLPGHCFAAGQGCQIDLWQLN